MSVRVLNSEVQSLGEGPHWIEAAKRLLIVDSDGCAVKFIDTTTGELTETHTFDDKIGSAIPYASDPNLLVVAKANRLVKYDIAKREIVETLVDVTEHEKGVKTRINDSKCDPYGRIVFGTMIYETAGGNFPANVGKLYSYSGKEGLRVLLDDVSLSNGLAWSRDNKTMFHVDTVPPKKLSAYDYSEGGELSNGRVLVDFSADKWSHLGFPDGMTIDVQDNLWVAVFGGNAVLHIDSRDGKLLDKVTIPSINTTSACFGGPDLGTLFVTSAGRHNIPEGVDEPDAGKVFAVTGLDTKGRLPVCFAG